MSYRIEIEILEAENVPTPLLGGAPHCCVVLSPKSLTTSQQRTRQLPSKTPVWCERFVFDGCQENDAICIEVLDQSDIQRTESYGKGEFSVGGPRRQVGSKWIPIGTLNLQVRVLWKVIRNLDWMIGGKTQDPVATYPVTDHSTENQQPVVTVEAIAASADHNDKQLHEKVDAILKERLSDLRIIVDERISVVEHKVDAIEGVFTTRRDYDLKRQKELLKTAGDSYFGISSYVPHPWVIASQASAAAVKEIKYDPKTQSALQSILTSPTVVPPHDEQLVSYHASSTVSLPKPRLIGFVPAGSCPGITRAT